MVRLHKLKAALAPLLGGKREARVTVTETGQGFDVAVEGARASPQGLSRLGGEGEALG
jgi:23S rRNA (uracil1939-C5)-methyltransferase